VTDEAPASEDTVTMVATWTDPAAIELLETSLPHVTHLKPLWERIRVKIVDGRACIGLPLSAKVTDETCDNHARHLYSLFNLLGVPLVPSPMALQRITLEDGDMRPLFYVDPKEEKEKAKAAAAAAAAAAAEAAAEAEAAEAAEAGIEAGTEAGTEAAEIAEDA
jgi:hypothetical protein